jgi:hypothetical protein
MLIRCVLRASRVRVRHPHGAQAQHIGEDVVGQRSPAIFLAMYQLMILYALRRMYLKIFAGRAANAV